MTKLCVGTIFAAVLMLAPDFADTTYAQSLGGRHRARGGGPVTVDPVGPDRFDRRGRAVRSGARYGVGYGNRGNFPHPGNYNYAYPGFGYGPGYGPAVPPPWYEPTPGPPAFEEKMDDALLRGDITGLTDTFNIFPGDKKKKPKVGSWRKEGMFQLPSDGGFNSLNKQPKTDKRPKPSLSSPNKAG